MDASVRVRSLVGQCLMNPDRYPQRKIGLVISLTHTSFSFSGLHETFLIHFKRNPV